jgi:hypothetical protein
MKSFDGSKNMFQNYFEAYKDYYGDDVFQNDDYLMYLIFSNIEEESASFCINMDDINIAGKDINVELSTAKFFVKSL